MGTHPEAGHPRQKGCGVSPVALLPPVTSGTHRPPGAVPLTSGPRYVRTRGMSRWHRSRSGWRDDQSTSIALWCGTFVRLNGEAGKSGLGIGCDDLPAGDQACGVCVGKALGAKQDPTPAGMPPLRFDPRYLTPPRLCPGSRSRTLWVGLGAGHHTVGRCLACRQIVAVRAMGRGYSTYGAGPVKHSPGPDLVGPCPWHAWNNIAVRGDGTVGCSCGHA